MQPLLVLVVMPLVVGVLAAVTFRDTRRASLAAALVSTAILYTCLSTLNPSGEWTALATFLVAPLTLAFALLAVLMVFGHGHLHRRPHH
jgi:lipopolysaccharide export LptBFGC system permease protein LptF